MRCMPLHRVQIDQLVRHIVHPYLEVSALSLLKLCHVEVQICGYICRLQAWEDFKLYTCTLGPLEDSNHSKDAPALYGSEFQFNQHHSIEQGIRKNFKKKKERKIDLRMQLSFEKFNSLVQWGQPHAQPNHPLKLSSVFWMNAQTFDALWEILTIW